MTAVLAGRFGAEAIISVLGVPVTSSPVTVYNHGTLTAATLYTDQTKGAAATNPINTDGLGNLTFYAVPGLYDLAFTVGGVPTTQVVEVEPWYSDITSPGDITGFPTISDYSVLAGSVPGSPRWLHKSPSAVVTTSAGGVAVVYFPTAFPNALTGLVACLGDTSGFALEIAIQQAGVSLTGFTALIGTNSVAGGSLTTANGVAVRINYMADGC